jgi:hypothetical protein
VADLTEFAAAESQMQQTSFRRRAHPDGWEPGVDTQRGVIVAPPSEEPSEPEDWDQILAEFKLDPAKWEVVSDRVNIRTWDAAIGDGQVRRFFYFKADVRPRRQKTVDIDRLCEEAARWRPRIATKGVAEGAFVLPAGDTQFGKVDNGGTEAIFRRLLDELGATARRLRRHNGRKSAALVVAPWLGDCIEGIWSQNASLRTRLDLTVTEQVRVYRRMMMTQVKLFAPLCERLVIPVVPGNHDEAVRTNDKMSSSYTDSWAIEGAVAVQDAVAENPELADKVRFVYPDPDDLTIAIDVAGTTLGMAHGHQFGSGTDGWKTWWDGQARGRTPVGDADILLGAHRHHLKISDYGAGRLFLQIPALDDGSTWWRHRQGDASPARLLSFFTADGHVWGLDPVTTRPWDGQEANRIT